MAPETQHLPQRPGIYMITNTLNGKVYIGQSQTMRRYKGVRGRCERHLELLSQGKNSQHLQHAWDSQGGEGFTFDCLLECPPEQCDYWEDYYIELFKSWQRLHGYNIDKCSRGRGRFSDETLQKLRKFTLTPEHLQKMLAGQHPHSEATREKLSKSHTGKKLTQAHKDKIGESSRGRLHSQEAKDKIRAKATGRRHSDATKELLRKTGAESVTPEAIERMRTLGSKPRTQEDRDKVSAQFKALVWVNDGERNRRVLPDEAIKLSHEGWKRGRK